MSHAQVSNGMLSTQVYQQINKIRRGLTFYSKTLAVVYSNKIVPLVKTLQALALLLCLHVMGSQLSELNAVLSECLLWDIYTGHRIPSFYSALM